MGILGSKGRGKAGKSQRRGRHAAPEKGDPDYVPPKRSTDDDEIPRPDGPYDIADAPDDGVARMDLGSVQVPIPENAQVQVQVDRSTDTLQSAHVLTPVGQVTISAFAAPRTKGIWPEAVRELADQLRSDGGEVGNVKGKWGPELSVKIGPNALHFVGVDGPRWLLRGVIAGPQEHADTAPELLRQLVELSIVDRGTAPMPVREPLPIRLSETMAQHVAEHQAQEDQAQEQ